MPREILFNVLIECHPSLLYEIDTKCYIEPASAQGSEGLQVYNPLTEQEQTSIPSIRELIKHLHDGQPRGYRQNRADKDTSTGRTIKAPQPSTEHKNPADQGNLLYKRNLEKDIRFLSFPLLFAAPLELGVGRGCVETWHV